MSHGCGPIRVKNVTASVRCIFANWQFWCGYVTTSLVMLPGQAVAQKYTGVDLYTLSQPTDLGYAFGGQVVGGQPSTGGKGSSQSVVAQAGVVPYHAVAWSGP